MSWSGECSRLALKLFYIAFEVALLNNLTTARWPTAFSSFLQHIFVSVKEAPIDRVVHQRCSQKCSSQTCPASLPKWLNETKLSNKYETGCKKWITSYSCHNSR